MGRPLVAAYAGPPVPPDPIDGAAAHDGLPGGARRIASADGEEVVVHDWGGHGSALLFTHGNGLNAAMWTLVARRLRRRFRCYGLDLRGHGWSRPSSADFPVSRPSFADDVLAAVDALDGPVAGIGHSLGGGALLHAELRRPGAFGALWLFEPVVVPDSFERPPGPSAIAEGARRRRIEFDSVEEAVERFLSKRPYDRCRPEAVRAYVEAGTMPLPGGGVRLTCSGDTEARIYEGAEAEDFGRFATVTCPAVVAMGDLVEGELPAVVATLVADALGAGRLRTFPGLTHLGPMEEPEQVARAIGDDLAG